LVGIVVVIVDGLFVVSTVGDSVTVSFVGLVLGACVIVGLSLVGVIVVAFVGLVVGLALGDTLVGLAVDDGDDVHTIGPTGGGTPVAEWTSMQ
jgi:hypothetical protein